jgi:hypothetical protein
VSGAEAPNRARWACPLVTALMSLAANPAALWPDRSYFFRDFSVTFQPLRDFFLRGLRDGHWPFWNPYSYEGSALLPTLYPLDLVQALWPGPVAASWLLTLHFPIAALTMYALARELGATRQGACAAGLAFSLGGLAQSSLNLCVFLEALALAPLVALTLRRAALRGAASIPPAALVLALSVTTLAVEFVGQAVLLGLALVLAAGLDGRRIGRCLAALGLGAALAGLPILMMRGIVAESLRSGGSIGALERSLHPLSLLQMLLPNFFLSLAEPVRFGWPHRLFLGSLPYFLSLYVGPFVLATAGLGLAAAPRRLRVALLTLGGLGVWYALGSYAGLAAFLGPFLPPFRYPVKAMLLPNLCLPLLVGLGASRLEQGRGWRTWASAVGALALLLLGLVVAAHAQVAELPAWFGVRADTLPAHLELMLRDVAIGLALAAVAVALGVAVSRRRMAAPLAGALGVGLLAFDLARGAFGLNPQTSPLLYRPLPEMQALVGKLGGGRVFSLGYAMSPRMNDFMASREPGLELSSFYLYRQLLNPFSNLLDDVDLAGGPDLHAFVPNGPLLKGREYFPQAVGGAARKLRNAAVVRVVSLDVIDAAELPLRAEVPTGLPGLDLHVYDLRAPWPHAFMACRVEVEADPARALERVLTEEFDAEHAVVLEAPAAAACSRASVLSRVAGAGEERYLVEADAPGILVMRDSYTRSFRASIDDVPARVLRANGRHRAVAVAAGRHRVHVFYDPPGFRAGCVLSGLSGLGAVGLFLRARRATRRS